MFSGLSVWSGQPIVWSFMGEATSPIPNFPRLPIVLCIGLRRHRFVSIQFDIFIGITLIQLTFGQLCWWGSTGIASDFIRGCNLTANYSDSLWPLHSFLLLFQNISWALSVGEFYDYIHWHWTLQLHFDWLWFSFVVFDCCKENFRWRLYLSVGTRTDVCRLLLGMMLV